MNPHLTKSTSHLLFQTPSNLKVTPRLTDNPYLNFKTEAEPHLKLDEFLSSCNYELRKIYECEVLLSYCHMEENIHYSNVTLNKHLLKITSANITRSAIAADPPVSRAGYLSDQKLLHLHQHAKNQFIPFVHF